MERKVIKHRIENGYGAKEGGFTIIEVLIAIAIFAIGMLAIASMQIGATQGTTTARINTELSTFASDQMERLASLPFDHDDLEANTPHSYSDNADRFLAEWTVEDEAVFEQTKTVTLMATDTLRGRTFTMQHVVARAIRGDH